MSFVVFPLRKDVCMLLLPANPYVAHSGRSLQLQERAGALGSLARRRRNIRMHWDVHSEVSRFHDFRFFEDSPSIHLSYPLLFR